MKRLSNDLVDVNGWFVNPASLMGNKGTRGDLCNTVKYI